MHVYSLLLSWPSGEPEIHCEACVEPRCNMDIPVLSNMSNIHFPFSRKQPVSLRPAPCLTFFTSAWFTSAGISCLRWAGSLSKPSHLPTCGLARENWDIQHNAALYFHKSPFSQSASLKSFLIMCNPCSVPGCWPFSTHKCPFGTKNAADMILLNISKPDKLG